MAEIESAEEFSKSLLSCHQREGWLAIIESRDAAIRAAAKFEVLRELCIWYAPELSLSPEVLAATQTREWPGLLGAIAELNAKYQSADSQPAQDGERR